MTIKTIADFIAHTQVYDSAGKPEKATGTITYGIAPPLEVRTAPDGTQTFFVDGREVSSEQFIRHSAKQAGLLRMGPAPEDKPDVVNAPNHYTFGGIETIDYMKAKSTPEEFRGHLRLTAMKYLSRAGHKDDTLQDYKKAAVYLGWLIKDMETGNIK